MTPKKVWSLLSAEEKKKSKFFLILTLINTFLEISIVLLVLPVTKILLNQIVEIPYFGELVFLKNYDYAFLSTLSVLSLILAFFIKNFFYSYFIFWQFKFIGNFELRISSKLMQKYLSLPYVFHLNNNSGILNNNVLNEAQHIPTNIFNILTLISETVILIFIGLILFIYEPKGSLYVIVFSITLMIIINIIQKNYMIKFGHQRYLFMGSSNKHLLQGLQSIKDIKLLNKERYFIENYKYNFKQAIKYKVYYDTLSNFPRPISELILVGAFAIIVSILVEKNDPNAIILTTSLFLIASYRLLPSITRITNAFQSIQLRKKVIENLINDLEKKETQIDDKNGYNRILNFKSNIILKNISFSYPNSNRNILNKINLKIDKGQMIGIVGPSGSGKTTLLDILLGLLEPTGGEIFVDSAKINSNNLLSWQKLIGYVPQSPTLIDDTIKKNIAFGIDENKIDNLLLKECIEKSNLSDFIQNQPDGINTLIGERGVRISGGQKQRIAIARSLYRNPEIIIFDEATSSLDEKNEYDIIKNISLLKKFKTTIVVAHKLSILKNCNIIYKINDGNLENN